jgi:hypothetical protein
VYSDNSEKQPAIRCFSGVTLPELQDLRGEEEIDG